MKTRYDALEATAARAGSGRNIDKKWQKADGTWVVGEILGQRLTIEILRLDPREYHDESEPECLSGYYAAANPKAVGSLIADVRALAEALQAARDTLVAYKFQPGDANCWEAHDEESLAKVNAALSRIQEAK